MTYRPTLTIICMEDRRERINYIIFIDTDAFVAFVKADDTNHQRAKELFKALETMAVEFCTSGYVFAEAVTVISQRISHETAVQFIDTLKSPDSTIQKLKDTSEVENTAILLFKEQTSKNVSFVDCTNMAFLRLNRMIGYIFSSDKVYKQNGFRTVEDLLT
jgi:predicted nucleic acid-binding protein